MRLESCETTVTFHAYGYQVTVGYADLHQVRANGNGGALTGAATIILFFVPDNDR